MYVLSKGGPECLKFSAKSFLEVSLSPLRANKKGDSNEEIDLTDSFNNLKVKDFSTGAEVQMPAFVQSTAK